MLARAATTTCDGDTVSAATTLPARARVQAGAAHVHASLDDARHCVFRPRRSPQAARVMQAHGWKPTRKQGVDVELVRAERDYEARPLDMKRCPRCDRPQSYKEVRERRKHCSSCEGSPAYRARQSWDSVRDGFHQRHEKRAERHRQRQEALIARVTTEAEGAMLARVRRRGPCDSRISAELAGKTTKAYEASADGARRHREALHRRAQLDMANNTV